jgi:hypothetical protein
VEPIPVPWQDLPDREHRCPRCLHLWVNHGVPGNEGYRCKEAINSRAELERGIVKTCECTYTDGNPVTPEWVSIDPL